MNEFQIFNKIAQYCLVHQMHVMLTDTTQAIEYRAQLLLTDVAIMAMMFCIAH